MILLLGHLALVTVVFDTGCDLVVLVIVRFLLLDYILVIRLFLDIESFHLSFDRFYVGKFSIFSFISDLS